MYAHCTCISSSTYAHACTCTCMYLCFKVLSLFELAFRHVQHWCHPLPRLLHGNHCGIHQHPQNLWGQPQTTLHMYIVNGNRSMLGHYRQAQTTLHIYNIANDNRSVLARTLQATDLHNFLTRILMSLSGIYIYMYIQYPCTGTCMYMYMSCTWNTTQ